MFIHLWNPTHSTCASPALQLWKPVISSARVASIASSADQNGYLEIVEELPNSLMMAHYVTVLPRHLTKATVTT